MHLSDYWNGKTELLAQDTAAFEGWEADDEVVVRKLIVMEVMLFPADGLTFYLHRDPWLKAFALNSEAPVDTKFLTEQRYLNKRDQLLATEFYAKDLASLTEIGAAAEDKENGRASSKTAVCKAIETLLRPGRFKKLTQTQRNAVELYEQVYFCPIELTNGYVEARIGTEAYNSILADQWKAANDMAGNISAQRNNMNNFYVSLMSILIGGILLSDRLLSANVWARTIIYPAIALVGFLLCIRWIAQIDNYKRLNEAKYGIINELEQYLPANIMRYEWLRTEQNARSGKRKLSFSDQEKLIPVIFCIIMIVIPLLLLLGTWLEPLRALSETNQGG